MSEEDLCEFGIVEEQCYFCGQPRTVSFNEHYTFCPNCGCEYTNFMLKKANCAHITKDTPTALMEPWFEKFKEKVYLREDKKGLFCSKCWVMSEADGW